MHGKSRIVSDLPTGYAQTNSIKTHTQLNFHLKHDDDDDDDDNNNNNNNNNNNKEAENKLKY
jgi:hypothetical protein